MVESLKELNHNRLGVFSMNMFGEALFTVVGADRLHEFLSNLERVKINPWRVIVSDVDYGGAMLIG
jgi:hypothetical protein